TSSPFAHNLPGSPSGAARYWIIRVHTTGSADPRLARNHELNSERIRERFGSFGLDILESSASRRVSSLYSLEDGRKVCRTYAVVEFGDAILPELAAEHALVMAGESIGAVFKGRGWTITKRHTRVGGTALGSADAGI